MHMREDWLLVLCPVLVEFTYGTGTTYTAAPEMKNHLSTLPSIGAGGWLSPRGMFLSCDAST